jgi:hypothetical protein
MLPLTKPDASALQLIASGPPHATPVSAVHVPSEAARSQRRHSPPMPPVPAQDATLQHTPCWQKVGAHWEADVQLLPSGCVADARHHHNNNNHHHLAQSNGNLIDSKRDRS